MTSLKNIRDKIRRMQAVEAAAVAAADATAETAAVQKKNIDTSDSLVSQSKLIFKYYFRIGPLFLLLRSSWSSFLKF